MRPGMSLRSVMPLLVLTIASGSLRAAAPLRDGDIIFHTSRSAQSVAIQRATHSPWSHMGVILIRDGMRGAAGTYAGKPYDLYFEWSDARIYCSELVWKMYRDALGIEVGARQKLREFDLSDPAVKAKMRERYGSHVPLNEPVISPGAMYDSPLLESIVTH